MAGSTNNCQISLPQLVLLLALLALFVFAGGAAAAEKPPRIVFKEEVHDFGTVKSGPELKHSFSFTNQGGAALQLKKVHATCSCTVARIDKMTYKKGERGRIQVAFATQGRQGRQEKSVLVESNDPQSPTVKLRIVCNIAGK